ncbi:MAG: hypothetical protein J6Y93_01315, partial [Treponema sp.]|nr:hypothetical protein [Treponema sp.]
MKRLAGALIAALCVLFSVHAQDRKTEVWDFGGIEEKGAVNHITIAKIDELEVLAADGKFSPGDITFGDLTVNVEKNDRAYYDGKKNYGSQGYASTKFEDEYCSGGMYYCNGKGGEGKRYLLLKNVRSGDTITFYARLSNSGEEKVHFASVDDKGQKEGSQDETGVLSTTAKAYTYTAVSSGTYKVYAEATAGKPVFFRIKRVPGVEVSGTIASLPQGKAVLNFVNQETKQSFPASISGSTYKTSLAPGASYTAVLSEIKGWGISSQTKELVIAGNASGALKKNLTAAEQKTFEISGKINGIDASYKSSDMELKLLPPQGSAYLPVSIPCRKENGQWIYRGDIEPSVSYSAVLEGAKDYQIKGKTDFEGTQAFT